MLFAYLSFFQTNTIENFAPHSKRPKVNPTRLEYAYKEVNYQSFSCDECDHFVTGHKTDGLKKGVKPGDVICLESGKLYRSLLFQNIEGTEENPIIIRNCGPGVARIESKGSFGVKFGKSKHFKFSGDGSDEKYGIRISTEKGYFMSMEYFTTNFHVNRVNIGMSEENLGTDRDGFAGISIKTSPYQDCATFTDPTRQAWILRDAHIYDNYIHDTGGEGLYIGHGFYKGRVEKRCESDVKTYSHSIKGLYIHDNLLENIGFDGMQIKNADHEVMVYNNIIRNYGTRDHGAHNEGLFIGEGTTGEFFGNIIDTGTGTGCQIQGIGNLSIHDNIFINSGKYGIYGASGPQVVRFPEGYFKIYNNAIINSKSYGFVFYNDDGGPKSFIDNLVVNAHDMTKNGAKMVMDGNKFYRDGDAFKFGIAQGKVGIQDKILLDKFNSYEKDIKISLAQIQK